MTYHVVIAFDWDAEGDLKPGEAREVLSPIIAERRARALAARTRQQELGGRPEVAR